MSNGKHLSKGSSIPLLPDDGLLRLYSMRFCPFAQRIHLVLNAKEIPYHTIFINLSEKPEWLTQVSPLGKVPALQLPTEPGNPLIESLVIAEYLNEKYPQKPLVSEDPLQKARDKILIERFSGVSGGVTKIIYKPDEAVQAIEDILKNLTLFEDELAKRGTSYFFGKQPGIIDYMIWPWFERLDLAKHLIPNSNFELDAAKYPNLLKWIAKMLEDPAVKKHYVPPETHAKFLKIRSTGNYQEAFDLLANK